MTRRTVPVPLVALVDALLVVVFAAIGRESHDESHPVWGALGTGWPFLVGAAVGWLIVLTVRRTAPLTVRQSWPVWLAAVAVGMLLRRLTGAGIAFSFIVVATIVLGVFLLGWRLLAVLLLRDRSAGAIDRHPPTVAGRADQE